MNSKTELVKNILLELAKILEYLGENRFKIIAYRKAVRSIEQANKPVDELYRSGELAKLSGVGKIIIEKIGEILETGKLQKLEQVKSKLPSEILEMLEKLPISGAKVKCITDNGIGSIEKLLNLYESNKLDTIANLGVKSIKSIKSYFNDIN
ncbi:hypothetical protein J7L68_04485 [bacterium]|nr:hypothetical protein [bacterium]